MRSFDEEDVARDHDQAILAHLLGKFSSIVLYRRNWACAELTVIDPAFEGLDDVASERLVTRELDQLPREIATDIVRLWAHAPGTIQRKMSHDYTARPVTATGDAQGTSDGSLRD
jgi:hypothetical protein